MAVRELSGRELSRPVEPDEPFSVASVECHFNALNAGDAMKAKRKKHCDKRDSAAGGSLR